MDEDMVGLSRVTAGNVYGTCTRCGTAFRRQRAVARKSKTIRDTQGLCPRCYREALRGELAAGEPAEEE